MIALGALMATAGCIFSPDTPSDKPQPPPPPPRFAGSADSLMANFKDAYSGMDIEKYREVLHTDFRFIFNPIDVTRLNLPTSFITRAEDIATTTNMFSGNTIIKPAPEDPVPGVSKITITQLDRVGVWTDIGADDPDFPNTERAVYNLEMNIYRVDNATTFLIRGQQEFYVSHRDSTVSGQVKPYYQLRGQRDLTQVTP